MMPPDPANAPPPIPARPSSAPADEFFKLRLALTRVTLPPAASSEELALARTALREIARNANHAVRSTDVSRPDDAVTNACFTARSRIADAREILARSNLSAADAALARRVLYRALALVAEGIAASREPAPASLSGIAPRAPLFPTFAPLVAAATRANPLDLPWILEVADAEVGIAVAQPTISRLSSERRGMLRELRGQIAAWTGGNRNADAGYALLNRLVLLIDCSNH